MLIPCSRQRFGTGVPASACFKILIIKLSEYLAIFIENLLKSRVFDFLLLSPIICGEHYRVFFRNLRFRNQRKRKYGSIETRGQLTNRKSIHDRPAEIEQRSRFGDLEIDTIVGKNHQQSLVSIVDRKTGYLWLKKCSTRKAEEVCQATIRLLEPIKAHLKTITADNGKEFSLHEYTAQQLDIDWYFADPYSAWQRGTNENTNGLIRQYIRKGSDLNDYTDAYIAEITQRLNHRPRKRLGFKSPSQVLWQQHGVALQMLI
ncbi:IS30 family transposase [Acinetobacter terrestris]|nr:IS30 family transposase [Acinetobacter terrestris]